MPKERNKADGYREKAYEGDTKAMNNLGVCYERGTGVKVNLEMALLLLVILPTLAIYKFTKEHKTESK